MKTNHLIEPIRCILETMEAPISEHALIVKLQSQQWLEPVDMADVLSLHATHFLVYNALFQLHSEYLEKNAYLNISALHIYLDQTVISHGAEQSRAIGETTENQADMEGLRDYYLNWENVESATKASLEQLINEFWDQWVNSDDLQEALTILELPQDHSILTLAQLKTAYRRLAMRHHPDRGGDNAHFQRINQSFRVLQKVVHKR